MASPFSITSATERASMSHRREDRVTTGTATFTIHNDGDVDERAVVEVVSVAGAADVAEADGAWLDLDQTAVSLPAHSADQVGVSITVPDDAAVGSYGFRLRAYSASGVPEETVAEGPMVTFAVEEVTDDGVPPWLWPAVAAGALAVVAVLAFLLWPNGDDPTTELEVLVTGGEFDDLAYAISCGGGADPTIEPPVAGLDAAAACQRLEDEDAVERLVEGPDPQRVCTQIFGGPQVATINGTLDGQEVDATVTRTDGCQISDWDRVLDGVLPEVEEPFAEQVPIEDDADEAALAPLGA